MSGKREHEGRTVRKEIRVAADPQEVWDAWASSAGIARWFVDRAEGEMEPGATVRWIFEAFGYDLPVEVFETERGRYLAFGGEAPGRPRALQEVFVVREGGATVLRLANSGFLDGEEWDDEYEGVDSGWELALATLKYVLEHPQSAPRTHLVSLRPAAFAYENLQPLFATSAGLCRWLAQEAELGRDPLDVGAAARLRLLDGLEWSGTVLARSRRELLLGRDDGRAVLGLKCFSMGPRGRFVGLDFNAWEAPAPDVAALQAAMAGALTRLVDLLPGAAS